jgi:hypothetical protein
LAVGPAPLGFGTKDVGWIAALQYHIFAMQQSAKDEQNVVKTRR